jgi:serine/threonine-protein kinase HipA
MKADPEQIIRSTTWGSPYEEGGEYRWDQITNQLSIWCEPETAMMMLKQLAHNFSV